MTPEQQADYALSLFRDGFDTVSIAAKLNLREWQASKLVWLARCRAQGLPAQYFNSVAGAVTEASSTIDRKSA